MTSGSNKIDTSYLTSEINNIIKDNNFSGIINDQNIFHWTR